MKILLTGGCGFIGSNLIRRALASGYGIINFDKVTYAGNPLSLSEIAGNPGYHFVHGDICNDSQLEGVFLKSSPDAVIHLAAESHVDRSIDDPEAFIQTNIVGTYRLLEAARKYRNSLPRKAQDSFFFLHGSTDEVFGSLDEEGFFTELTPYSPRSPYSASKASSDHFVRAYFHTYGLPVLVTNCSNNYGPRQFPEKLIPHIILNALNGKPLPVYGDGMNVRDWLYVEDHCSALLAVLEKGIPGETYVIGGNSERTNLSVVRTVCEILDGKRPRRDGKSYKDLIVFVSDRPGHDRRYGINANKIRSQLGWKPEVSFESGMEMTVEWYLNNQHWTDSILKGSYRVERLGLRRDGR